MNAKQYITHEKKWLNKAEEIMMQELSISQLNPIEMNKFRELVSRVLQAEYEFLNESPEEYQEMYGGNELRIVD